MFCSLLTILQSIGISSLDLFQRQQSPPPFLQLPFPPASWFPHPLFTILPFQQATKPLWYRRMKAGNSHLDFGGVWHLQPIKLKAPSKPKDVVPRSGMYLPTELPRLQLGTTLEMLGIISTIFTNKVCACHDVNYVALWHKRTASCHCQLSSSCTRYCESKLLTYDRYR